MRTILCLALLMSALLLPPRLFTGARAAANCLVDNDHDGVCALEDCDDYNPYIQRDNGNDDLDGDGVTPCEGDCDDENPEIQQCRRTVTKESNIQPFYEVPPDNCGGLIITTEGYRCPVDERVFTTSCVKVYEWTDIVLNDCFPY